MKLLKFRQIEEKLNALMKVTELFRGVQSWCKYVRNGLGMSMEQLASRAGVSKSTIAQIERNEASDKITLASLNKVASAMNCEVIYALVPKEKLSVIRDKQAEKKAKALIKDSHLHMEYEDQAVDKKKLEIQLEELKEKVKNSRNLWDL